MGGAKAGLSGVQAGLSGVQASVCGPQFRPRRSHARRRAVRRSTAD